MSAKYPYARRLRSSKPYIISTVAFAVFTDLFLYGLIVAVLPFSLPTRSNVPTDDVQSWIAILLAVFAGSMAAVSPLVSWASERSATRRTPYLVGGVVLTASTLMLCLGRSIPVLLVARILQGASGAVAWVVGPSLVVDVFGPSNDVGQAMGYVGLAAAAATVLGPLMGGVLYAAGGYYAPFGLAFGLLAVDLLLRLFLVEQGVLEPTSSASASASASELEDASEKPVAPQSTTSISNGSSIWSLLKSSRFLTATFTILSVSILLTSFDATLALFVRDEFNWSSTGAGLIYLPLMIPSLFAPLLGKIVDGHGSKWMVTIGFAVVVPSYVCLRFVEHGGIRQVVLLCALLFLIGCGVAAGLTPTMTEMSFCLSDSRETDASVATNPVPALGSRPVTDLPQEVRSEKTDGMASVYGVFNMSWAVGNAVGPLWAGYVRDDFGWSSMAWSLGLLAGVTALLTLVWMGPRPIYRRDAS